MIVHWSDRGAGPGISAAKSVHMKLARVEEKIIKQTKPPHRANRRLNPGFTFHLAGKLLIDISRF
jgi:hypothetical protein